MRDGIIPNAKTLKPKLYHLYREAEVREDLNRKGRRAARGVAPAGAGGIQPPGRGLAEGPARVGDGRPHFATGPPHCLQPDRDGGSAGTLVQHRAGSVAELRASKRTLRVDSKVLEKAEIGESAGTDKDYDATSVLFSTPR